MYKIGVLPGKFSPPHRGHLNAIIQASTKCEKLYVVISHNSELEEKLYENSKMNPITLKQKARWLSKELESFKTIKVIMMDEGNIPMYPNGWKHWSELLKETIPENIEVIFGGEISYKDEGYTKYFPETIYEIYEEDRVRYPISATKIRENPYGNWDYILGSARSHFVKKILIVGTESCAKTSTVEKLAKIFYTSWAREEGRYYSSKYMGSNEDVFELDDFYKIALEQKELENQAIRNGNKITFLDTDALVTKYYCQQYLGENNPKLEALIEPNKYDCVLIFTPDVKWVNDGLRFLSEDKLRWELHEKIKNMYINYGYKNIIEVSGDYNQRLNSCINIVDKILNQEDVSFYVKE